MYEFLKPYTLVGFEPGIFYSDTMTTMPRRQGYKAAV
jgi:hypothetical protein